MPVDPELFRSQGIEPLRIKIVVVKSPNGFREAYEPFAKAVFGGYSRRHLLGQLG